MKHIHRYFLWLLPLLCGLLAGCGADVPASYSEVKRLPSVFPDYRAVTVPSNIAPLHFLIRETGDDFVTRFSSGNAEIVCSGARVCPDLDEWRSLLAAAKGGRITVDVFARADGRWSKFASFPIDVASEPIDPYLSYRLISPSYVTYEALTINQRDLTSFEESEIYNNMLGSEGSDGQCINCHSYQNYSPQNMQFHARQTYGGTMIVVDGVPRKVDLKADSSVISAGVYPSWHPKKPLIAYSVNTTGQSFHTKDLEKVEVQDSHSDLILYDVEANTVQMIANEPDELETFPWWAPEGDYLYFCSAHYHYDAKGGDRKLMDDYRSIHYNVYRMPYDGASGTFGPRELVFDADSIGRSATMPRISPDGRWLVFSLGDYGCFHVWHKSSDLWIMDLGTDPHHADLAAARRSARKLEEACSPDVETQPFWSSNSRWLLFSSRRDDGSYTRPYIAYVDKEGKARKPFILPQDDPEFYLDFYRSFNLPVFMSGPVTISPQRFAREFKSEGVKATFRK